MRVKHLVAAAALALSATALQSPVTAAPFSPEANVAAGIEAIPVHRTCHANVQRHFAPEVGASVDHLHTGQNCRIRVVEEEEEDDCHANAEAHRLPGYGNRPVLHRHRGQNCRVVLLEDEEDDCHREPQRHSLPGLGRVWHRHVGASCRVEELDVYRPGQSTRGCIRVGPVTVCP